MKKRLIILLSFLLMTISFANEKVEKTTYKIGTINLKNLKEIPESKILHTIKNKKGDMFSIDKILKDYEKIKTLTYVDDVEILYDYVGDEVNLTFVINEKKDSLNLLLKEGITPVSYIDNSDKSLTIEEITVSGNNNISKDEILAMLPLKVDGYYSQKKLAEGYRTIGETGFFREVIPDITKTGDKVKIDLYVTENPLVAGINIVGNTVYTTDEILAMMKTKKDQILNYNNLREDREAILSKYNIDGYSLAKIIDISVNNSYELDIIISEGTIRDIEVKKMLSKRRGGRREASDNLLKTRSYIIDREIELKEDSLFLDKNYQETVNNLMRLGYIKNVKYETEDILGDIDGKKLTLLIEEDRTARIQGTISYGSESGFLGMLSLEESNWKGKGQNLGFSFEKSDDNYSSISLNFSDPWIKDTNRISWGWSLYRTEYEDSDSYAFNEVTTQGFKINIGKGLSKNVRFGLGLKTEQVETNPNDEYKKYYPTDKYWLYSVTPTLSYDSRNSYLNPTKGSYYRASVELGYASGEEIYGTGYFTAITGEVRKYHKGFNIAQKNTFAYRLIGGIQSDDIKESQIYTVGGSSTIRGFDGGAFKGREKLIFNIENRTEFNDILGLVLFVDVGRAWNYNGVDGGYDKAKEVDFHDDVVVGAGVGLRVNTPMGPLRFDFGWPVVKGDDYEVDKGMQFYFNMGHSF